MSEIEGWFSSW